MAIVLNSDARHGALELREFVEFAESIDIESPEALTDVAPMLRALADNRSLIVNHLNTQIKTLFRENALQSTQVLFLAGGKGFYVRANLWPSQADMSAERSLQEQGYGIAHDHNYSFVTAAYSGSGYLSDLFTYDADSITGQVGEAVRLDFVERIHFRDRMVMIYEANRDVHAQLPPADFSITLNFMPATDSVRLRDQFFFDLERRVLMDYPGDLDVSKRVSMLKIAQHLGDGDTTQLLHDLSAGHPCRRTRLAAFEALATLDFSSAATTWESALRDPEELVQRRARAELAARSY